MKWTWIIYDRYNTVISIGKILYPRQNEAQEEGYEFLKRNHPDKETYYVDILYFSDSQH